MIQGFETKKRFFNLVLGVGFGFLAIHASPSPWAYLFAFLSIMLLAYVNKSTRFFVVDQPKGAKVVKKIEVELEEPEAGRKPRN